MASTQDHFGTERELLVRMLREHPEFGEHLYRWLSGKTDFCEIPELQALIDRMINKQMSIPELRNQLVMFIKMRQYSDKYPKLRKPKRLRRKMSLKRILSKDLITFRTKPDSEDWAISLGWFIPRKYRHVIGDILEDCVEMREAGCTERRIKFHVVYQWLIAVITLVPTAVKTSITDILKQALSPPK